MKVNRKRLDRLWREKLLEPELEEEVAYWVYSLYQKMLNVSRKMIMFKATIFDDKTTDPASRGAFIASRGWCEKNYEGSSVTYPESFRCQYTGLGAQTMCPNLTKTDGKQHQNNISYSTHMRLRVARHLI